MPQKLRKPVAFNARTAPEGREQGADLGIHGVLRPPGLWPASPTAVWSEVTRWRQARSMFRLKGLSGFVGGDAEI